jgi:deoxyribose-phosphate aldolase
MTPAFEVINMDLNKIIDHTLLKPEATYREIEKLCQEAKEYGFATVCVNPVHVRLAAKLLRACEKTGVKVCTVIGFPLGAGVPLTKAVEVREAIANGATEVDMVINIGALKSGDYELVFRDIKAVVDAAAGQALTKVIIETCLLTDEEKVKACLLAKEAGAGFVKTSTGFNKSGATAEDVALLRKVVGTAMGVKASGGIRDRRTAEEMVKAGANRLGTSSGVAIMKEEQEKTQGRDMGKT